MIVILKQDVPGTGKAGEVVKVSDGFARNMLIPRGMALEATEGNVRNLEKQQELQRKKAADSKAHAQAQAEDLKSKKVVIKAKAGEGGRLFGAITSKDVSEAIKSQLGMDVDKKKIELENPIKNIGTYEAVIKLYPEVKGSLKVEVEAE